MKRHLAVISAICLMVVASCTSSPTTSGSSTSTASLPSTETPATTSAVASPTPSTSSPVASPDTATVAESASTPATDVAASSLDSSGASTSNTESAGGDSSLPVLIIHPYDGTPEYGVIRPASVASSGDGNNIIDQMVWTSWTATGAHATAMREVQSCNPSCADGTITPVPMTFDLSDPVNGRFTKVTETINGETTVLTDKGFTPGNLGFVGITMGPDSLKLPTPAAAPEPTQLPTSNGLPVLIIYPDGGVPYAVVRPESIWGAAGSPKLSNIVWDHWTATEAVGTGSVQGKDASTGEMRTDQATITLTNPVRGAFNTFAIASATPHVVINFPATDDPHYRFSAPDSARVATPCGC